MKEVMSEEADETSNSVASTSTSAVATSATSPTTTAAAAAESGEAGPVALASNSSNQLQSLGESSQTLAGGVNNNNLNQSQQSTQQQRIMHGMSQYSTLDDDKIVNVSAVRVRKFPNLNYSTLYHSLLNLIEVVPSIQTGQIGIGQALIHTFGCLAPFLTDDLIDSLPYTIALTLTSFPRDLHKYIMEVLCNSLLPIASKLACFQFSLLNLNFNYFFLFLQKSIVIKTKTRF